MRFSIVLSTQPASFSALAYQGRLRENLAGIKRLGYDGVELAVRDPSLVDPGELQSMLADTGLPVPAIGTGQAYGEEGLSLTSLSPEIRKRAMERIKSQVHFARGLNATVIIGLIRGRKEAGITQDEATDRLEESLRECADEDRSVKLAIEPINRYETDLLNTVASGLNFLERLGAENVGLLLDTFHMNIEEPSILRSIECAGDRIFHFHVADSNRWYPGAGHIEFGAIFDALGRIGYPGFVSAEILPLPDSDTAAARTILYLRQSAYP